MIEFNLNVTLLQGECHGVAVPGLYITEGPLYTRLHVYSALPNMLPIHEPEQALNGTITGSEKGSASTYEYQQWLAKRREWLMAHGKMPADE